MLKSSISLIFLSAVLFAFPCFSTTDVPDLVLSEAVCAYSGQGNPALLVLPDESGPAFTAARDQEGNLVDATITLFLRDSQNVPFILFPREDMWLESVDEGLVSCTWGLMADENTDHDGMTWWILPPAAGGFSEGNVQVWVNGAPLASPGINLRFNSPDINGDLLVNLQDVAIFASDYFVNYHFRSDFYHDGVIDLRDLTILAQKMLAGCP